MEKLQEPTQSSGQTYCSVCGGHQFKNFGIPKASPQTYRLRSGDHNILQCQACGFYFVHPIVEFSREDLTKIYTDQFFIPQRKKRSNSMFERRRVRIARENLLLKLKGEYESDGNLKILEVGCGDGYVLWQASLEGMEAHGVDVVDSRIQDATGPSIVFFCGELAEANFLSDYFDLFYCSHCLEHIIDPNHFLREVKRIVKPGGKIFLSVPNENSWISHLKWLYYRLSGKRSVSYKLSPFVEPYHVNGFSEKSLAVICARHGFTVLHCRTVGPLGEFLGHIPFSFSWFFYLLTWTLQVLAKPFGAYLYIDCIAVVPAKNSDDRA
jgi:SAM-dependent methyltransferase